MDSVVSISDPDFFFHPPIFEGMAGNAYKHIVPGDYDGVDWEYLPVKVRVTETYSYILD